MKVKELGKIRTELYRAWENVGDEMREFKNKYFDDLASLDLYRLNKDYLEFIQIVTKMIDDITDLENKEIKKF